MLFCSCLIIARCLHMIKKLDILRLELARENGMHGASTHLQEVLLFHVFEIGLEVIQYFVNSLMLFFEFLAQITHIRKETACRLVFGYFLGQLGQELDLVDFLCESISLLFELCLHVLNIHFDLQLVFSHMALIDTLDLFGNFIHKLVLRVTDEITATGVRG